MIGSNQLAWRAIENGFALHRWQTKTPLLHVVPDTVHPGMWRIRSLDGRLTDMANLPRARDAAVAIALETLNAGKRGRQSPLETAPVCSEPAPLLSTLDQWRQASSQLVSGLGEPALDAAERGGAAAAAASPAADDRDRDEESRR